MIIYFSFLLSPLSSLLSAQVPHSFSYQAVVRNSQGEPLSFQPVSFRISLLQESPGGTVSYQETHLQTTNFFGLVNLEIGNGKVVTGAMDTIRWDLHRYFINVEADISGNNNFVAMGTTQLLSVPYALYAEKAGGGRQEADLDWEVIGNDVVTGHGGSYPTGNVGIGNNAPGSLLYVAKNTGEPTITIRNMGGGGGASYSMVDDLSGASWKFKATTFGGFKIRDQANALDVFTIEPNSAANSLYIKTGGNIGIGTTLPAFKVDVLGNVNASGYYKGGIPFLPSGLQDLDGDTRIAVEENPDEDSIRFYTGGLERLRLTGNRLEMPNNAGNILLGDKSGEAITTGSSNIFIGDSAGARNTEGSINTFLGTWSGTSNTTGNSNTFIGFLSGSKNTTGNYNTFVGMLSGRWNTTGYVNTFVGMFSGRNNKTGNSNAFFGYETGHENTTGEGNTFFGTLSGHNNQTGARNTYLGLAAGFANQTGNENTFVGGNAGFNSTGSDNVFIGAYAGENTAGSDNVFIGKYAGQHETGSGKLYISTHGGNGPLIYGDFTKGKLIFNTYSVETGGRMKAFGEIRTDQEFNVNGNEGIRDTLNHITAFDFANDKLKYRTTIFTGGIVTWLSDESDWVDNVGDPIVPPAICGEISLVGEFNGWGGDTATMPDHMMTRDDEDLNFWTTIFKMTAADDHSEPPDNIVELKFRENCSWDVNWGSFEFPTGIGYQGYGNNIPAPLNPGYDTTVYYVTFHCMTDYYTFEDQSGTSPDSGIGATGQEGEMDHQLNTATINNKFIRP